MSDKPRVCYFIPTLNPGGTERQLLYLIEGLRDTHECTVVCTREAGAWSDRARDCGAQVFELRTLGGWDFRIGWRARNLIEKHRWDIVHTFLSGFDLPVNRASRALGVPVVISSRRELAAWMKPRHLQKQRAANAYVDVVVANSHAVARYAAETEGLDPSRVRVIHNGIDVEAFTRDSGTPDDISIPAGRKIVGMVANFSPVKDHALFLGMAEALLKSRVDIHFLLVGSGLLQRQAVAAIHRCGMQEAFTIASTLDNVAGYLARMDVCVSTSQREGFPNAILEAMAMGRPVVAAGVGGIPELIEDGRSGLLVATREPAHFVAAVTRVLDDADLATRLGAAAHERVCGAFSTAAMVDAHRSLYAAFLDRARGVGQ